MTSPRSARASDLRTAASAGTLPSFLSDGWVREADSRSFALPAVRHSSMTRRALKALARVNASVTGSRPSPADMSGMSRPGHPQ